MTPLDKPLRRELNVDGNYFVLTLSPASLKITPKGKRKGVELAWVDLVSGETALAVALRASVGQLEQKQPRAARA